MPPLLVARVVAAAQGFLAENRGLLEPADIAVRLGHEDDELVASDPVRRVNASTGSDEMLRNAVDACVTGGVALRVVAQI
jgi:hypothetical protein